MADCRSGAALVVDGNDHGAHEPYQLPLELARGTLNRVRNLMADWQASGLTIPPLAQTHLTESLKSFVQAVARQMTPIPSAEAAEQSIIESLAAIDAISQAVVEHVAEHSPAAAIESSAVVCGAAEQFGSATRS